MSKNVDSESSESPIGRHEEIRPNILFIMADDHAPHALGCYGSQIAKTPHLDQLASQGMRFTQAMDTVALCAPSRAALLSGAYSHINGFKRNEGLPFDGSQPTFPKLLQEAGYATAIFGKWHLGSQPTGFDHYKVIPGHGRFWDCPFRSSDRDWEELVIEEGYLTEVITDHTLAWLQQHVGNSRVAEDGNRQPFCAMVHHKAPHTPHEYPERYEALFQEDIPVPEHFHDDWVGREVLRDSPGRWSKIEKMVEEDLWGNELGQREIPSREDELAFKSWAYQTFMKGYLRLVAAMDENIGRLLEGLEEMGLAENTLVIYSSDNGFFLGDHGLYNKMWMYEQALRLPMIARWPGQIPAGTICNDMVSLIDLAPSFCELAGAEVIDRFQGKSLVNAWRGGGVPREVHYYHYVSQFDVPDHCGIRTEQYKLICFYHADQEKAWELYDLKADPGEMKNLVREGEVDLLQQMQSLLIKEATRLKDPVRDVIRKQCPDLPFSPG